MVSACTVKAVSNKEPKVISKACCNRDFNVIIRMNLICERNEIMLMAILNENTMRVILFVLLLMFIAMQVSLMPFMFPFVFCNVHLDIFISSPIKRMDVFIMALK